MQGAIPMSMLSTYWGNRRGAVVGELFLPTRMPMPKPVPMSMSKPNARANVTATDLRWNRWRGGWAAYPFGWHHALLLVLPHHQYSLSQDFPFLLFFISLLSFSFWWFIRGQLPFKGSLKETLFAPKAPMIDQLKDAILKNWRHCDAGLGEVRCIPDICHRSCLCANFLPGNTKFV